MLNSLHDDMQSAYRTSHRAFNWNSTAPCSSWHYLCTRQ
jgi:hypothetical protein